MDNTVSKLVRPGDSRVPCFAILNGKPSKLKLINLEGRSSSSVKISDRRSRGIVTNDGEVYAITRKEILKLHSDGSKTLMQQLKYELHWSSRVVSFRKKIYIVRPEGKSMLCFDPVNNSLTGDLPGCGLGWGLCASATDDFIYAMGGSGTEKRAKKYDPLTRAWEATAPMRKGRNGAAAVTLDGKIYIIGGLKHGASVEYYDPVDNCWTEISNTNVGHRSCFNACVVDGQLYAATREEKNGFYQHSIENFYKNKWTLVTKFETEDHRIRLCFWPHGSSQPDGSMQPKDLTKSVVKMYIQLRSENLLEIKTKIGSKRERTEYVGCKIRLPEGALKEEKEVTLSARAGVDQKKGMPDITPIFECNPPVTFEKPVSMTLRTCISAPAGKIIPACLLTRDNPGDEWKETKQLSLGQRNEVDFEIQCWGGIKVVAESFDVKLHSINGFHINLDTGITAVTFSKDQAVYDAVEKSMHKNGFVDFALIPHDVQGKFGSKISVSMKQKQPKDITISKALPSPTFTLDEDYLQRGKHTVYFELDPEPDECRIISMQYGYKVDGEPEQHLPLKTKWPQKNTKRGSRVTGLKFGDGTAVTLNNCKFNVHGGANATAAVGFGLGDQGTVNIKGNVDVHAGAKGDVSTVVNAPVGQLATGNANITNQGSRNNYVTGDRQSEEADEKQIQTSVEN